MCVCVARTLKIHNNNNNRSNSITHIRRRKRHDKHAQHMWSNEMQNKHQPKRILYIGYFEITLVFVVVCCFLVFLFYKHRFVLFIHLFLLFSSFLLFLYFLICCHTPNHKHNRIGCAHTSMIQCVRVPIWVGKWEPFANRPAYTSQCIIRRT